MSARSMFYRIFRIPQKPGEDALGWLVERHDTPSYYDKPGDAATIPISMMKGHPEVAKAIVEDTHPTAVIPKVEDDLHTDIVAYRIETAYNDVDATCRAATAVRTGNWRDALEGLLRYAALHPDEAMMPVAA